MEKIYAAVYESEYGWYKRISIENPDTRIYVINKKYTIMIWSKKNIFYQTAKEIYYDKNDWEYKNGEYVYYENISVTIERIIDNISKNISTKTNKYIIRLLSKISNDKRFEKIYKSNCGDFVECKEFFNKKAATSFSGAKDIIAARKKEENFISNILINGIKNIDKYITDILLKKITRSNKSRNT